MSHHRTSISPCKKGQGMAEFALILPLLLLLIFAVFEFGRLLFVYAAVHTASREAARYGTAAGDIGDLNASPRYIDCAGIRAAGMRVGSLAGISSSDITIQYDHGPTESNPNPAAFTTCEAITSPGDIQQGDRIVVETSVVYRPVVPLPFVETLNISARSSRTIVKDIAIRGGGNYGSTPQVCFDSSASSIDEGGGTARIPVVLQGASAGSEAVTATFQVLGGTADAGDYHVGSTTVTFPPGSPAGSIRYASVTIIDDAIFEEEEDFSVWLIDADNAERCLSPLEHTLTIIDNDPPLITFTAASSQIRETDGALQIDFELRHPDTGAVVVTPRDIPVNISVDASISSAVQGMDFTLLAHSLTIPRGSSGGFVTLVPVDDDLYELDETAVLNISSPLADPGPVTSHEVTMTSDDPMPLVRFVKAESYAPEKNTSVDVEVQLIHPVTGAAAPSGVDTRVHFSNSGTATNGFDYTTSPSPIYIPAGATSASIRAAIRADAEPEDEETAVFDLVSADHAVVGEPHQHTLYISNYMVSFQYERQQVRETPGGIEVSVPVQVSGSPSRPVQVNLVVSGTATGGQDYRISYPADGLLEIPVGQMAAAVRLQVLDDALDENTETIILTLKDSLNAGIDAPSVHTIEIQDDDEPPAVYFTTGSTTAGEADGVVQLVVQISAPSGRQVTVPVVTGGTAIRGSSADYTLVPGGGSITFQPGETQAVLEIHLKDDNLYEADETIILDLGTPVGAVLGAVKRHVLTIKDNDEIPRVWFTASEQIVDESAGEVSVGLQLDRVSALPVKVPLHIRHDSTLAAGSDYGSVPAEVTIPAGKTTATFKISINDDHIPEASERLILVMGEPQNAVRRSIPEEHTVWVTDNDQIQCQEMYPTGPLSLTGKSGPMKYSTYFTNLGSEDVFITQVNLGWVIKNGAGSNEEIKLTSIALGDRIIWDGSSDPKKTPVSIPVLSTGSLLNEGNNYLTLNFYNFAGNHVKLERLTHLTVRLSNDCSMSWNVHQR